MVGVQAEIRPIDRSEAVDYLRVLPFAVGLPNWEPAPAAWHGGPGAWPPPRQPASEDDLLVFVDGIMDDGCHPQAGDVLGDAVNLDRHRLAEDLAQFLVELRGVPADEGPACGRHSFFRGCHPSVYADQVQQALAGLGESVDQPACRAVWREAMTSVWRQNPVWFHGDLAEGNVLIRDSTLSAVIDFGTCGVGDPACDLVIAWTFMAEERDAFRAAAQLDADTWARARGWALWKALVSLTDPTSLHYQVRKKALTNLLSDWR